MSNASLDGLACFAPGLSISERGRRANLLTKACDKHHYARHICAMLGSPSDAERMARALEAINGLPATTFRHVVATYAKLDKTSKQVAA
jgi:hypothetical protein